ncbi:MAG: WD40 repeat domain-containing serine/threonine-protein kinase [Myxococcota bacterium]
MSDSDERLYATFEGAFSGPNFSRTPSPTREPGALGDSPHLSPAIDGDRYALRGELGRGGMGRVFAAHDSHLNRDVALKEIRLQGADGQLRQRLLREAQITAQLEHPNIVSVYDAGETEDGRLFYTMQLVRGRTLAAAIAASADLPARLRLLRAFLAACNAVAYAHSRGVVHRDLKPQNIMLGPFGEVLVVDWGLAAQVGAAPGASAEPASPDAPAVLTRAGSILGTPRYMSPEQAAGQPAAPPADVWALGMVLLELLSGCAPYDGESGEEMIAALRSGRAPDVSAQAADAPAELVAIAQQALSVDRSRRYPEAERLAQDIEAYLEGRQVSAHEYTTAELVRRLVHRWRVPLMITGLALIVVATVLVGAWLRGAQERSRALAAEQIALIAEAEADESLAQALIQQAERALTLRARPEAELLAASALLRSENPRARGVLAAYADSPRPTRIAEGPAPPGCIRAALTLDGADALCFSIDAVSMWSLSPLAQRWVTPLPPVDHLHVTADAAFVQLSSQDNHRLLRIALDDGVVTPLALEGLTPWFTVTPDGHRVLFGNAVSTRYEVVDLRSGAIVSAIPGPQLGKTIPIPGQGTALIVDFASKQIWQLPLNGEPFRGIEALSNEDVISTAGWGADAFIVGTSSGRILLFDAETLSVRWETRSSNHRAVALCAMPKAGILAVQDETGLVEFWEPETGGLVGRLPQLSAHSLRAHDGALTQLGHERWVRWRPAADPYPNVFLTDLGLTTVTPEVDGTIYTAGHELRRHRLRDGRQELILDDLDLIKSVSVTPSKELVLGTVSHGLLRGVPPEIEPQSVGMTRRTVALADGSVLTAGYSKNALHIFPPDADPLHPDMPQIFELDAATGGATAAMLDAGLQSIWIWRPGAARPMRWRDNAIGAYTVAVSPDGQWLATANAQTLQLHTETETVTLPYPQGKIYDLAISPDGVWLAAGCRSGRTFVWRIADRRLVFVLGGHQDIVSDVTFSADSRTLFTASWDQSARRWSLDDAGDPKTIFEEISAAWGLSLEDVLARPL